MWRAVLLTTAGMSTTDGDEHPLRSTESHITLLLRQQHSLTSPLPRRPVLLDPQLSRSDHLSEALLHPRLAPRLATTPRLKRNLFLPPDLASSWSSSPTAPSIAHTEAAGTSLADQHLNQVRA